MRNKQPSLGHKLKRLQTLFFSIIVINSLSPVVSFFYSPINKFFPLAEIFLTKSNQFEALGSNSGWIYNFLFSAIIFLTGIFGIMLYKSYNKRREGLILILANLFFCIIGILIEVFTDMGLLANNEDDVKLNNMEILANFFWLIAFVLIIYYFGRKFLKILYPHYMNR